MQKAKKVNVEVVGRKKESRLKRKVTGVLNRVKIFVAILLDGIDLLLGLIPVVNTAWDIVTFVILLIMLKNKRLAFLSLLELPFFGLPPFSFVDIFIPVATITTLLDISMSSADSPAFYYKRIH